MTDPHDDPARARYFAIAFTRLGSVMVCLIGLVVIGRSVTTTGNIVGLAIMVAGLVAMAMAPRELARRWRSPRP